MQARLIIPSAAQLAEIRRRTKELDRLEPRADRVVYDARKKQLVLALRRGATVSLPVERIRWLNGATPRQLRTIRTDQFGTGIVLDALDVHISIQGLLSDLVGFTGSPALMGAEGGKVKSPAKAAAARANGKRGGRPRKKAAA
jgi:Protein of unknown function (DUF2442)